MLSALPTLIEPDVWTLSFHRTSKYWWVRALAVGRYKHVSAFAWVPALDLWVVYDVTLPGTKITLLPDSPTATTWLAERTADADLVRWRQIPPNNSAGGIGDRRNGGIILAPFSCVSAIRHLIGIPAGALPSSLYRAVIAHGGELIDGRPTSDSEPGDARPGAASAEAHG